MNRFGESISGGQVDPLAPTAAELTKRNLLAAVEEALEDTTTLIESLQTVDYHDPGRASHFTKLSPPKAGHVTNIYDELAYLKEYLGGLAEDLGKDGT